MKNFNISYSNQNVEVYLENNILSKLNLILDSSRKYFILTDEVVYNLYFKEIKIENCYFKIIKSGEAQKNITIIYDVILEMLDVNITKTDVLINFGGGVISDIGGFVAAIYKRGIEYYNIPTTLLAMVDAAIGGKTAVDIISENKVYKNQIGSIYHPSKVIIDPSLLKTLSDGEYLSGLGEIIKYGLCFDKALFESLFTDFLIEDVIYKCLKIKADITSKDEHDNNLRLALNYGHTIGHAVEAITKFKVPHGICILYGIIIETSDQIIKDLLFQLINKLNLKFDFEIDLKDLEKYIIQDKKIKGTNILLPVLKEIGVVEVKEIKIADFLKRVL